MLSTSPPSYDRYLTYHSTLVPSNLARRSRHYAHSGSKPASPIQDSVNVQTRTTENPLLRFPHLVSYPARSGETPYFKSLLYAVTLLWVRSTYFLAYVVSDDNMPPFVPRIQLRTQTRRWCVTDGGMPPPLNNPKGRSRRWLRHNVGLHDINV